MTTVIDTFEKFVLSPRATVESVVRERRYGAAFAGYLLAVLGFYFWSEAGGTGISIGGFAFGVAWRFTLAILKGLLYAAFVHMTLSFLKQKGSAAGLFILIGISASVFALLLPLSLISELAGRYGFGLHWLVLFITAALQFVLLVELVKISYNTTPAKAWTALLAPVVFWILVVFAVIVSLAVALFLAAAFFVA
ncbi:MAG: hypothetical protein WCS77_07545 [Elusimicrobiaceae bacterium]